jgi:hypothetical protein
MLRRRLLSRLVLAGIAAAQSLAPGFASLADARPEAFALSRRVAPHVERFGATHQWRTHLDNCALCQISARKLAPPNVAPPLLAAIGRAPHVVEPRYAAPLTGQWAAPNSRAPPVT